MALQIKVTETGLKEANKIFKELGKRTKDYSFVWEEFIDYYQNTVIPKAFDSRGASMGKKWDPLATGGNATLRKSDRLYNAARGKTGWKEKINKKDLTMEIVGIPYDDVHQYGNDVTPQRPYFFTANENLPKEAWDFLIELADKYLDESTLKKRL